VLVVVVVPVLVLVLFVPLVDGSSPHAASAVAPTAITIAPTKVLFIVGLLRCISFAAGKPAAKVQGLAVLQNVGACLPAFGTPFIRIRTEWLQLSIVFVRATAR
jgi:hypothetical protein